MRHKFSVFSFVLLIAIYSSFTLFVFAPFFSNMINRTLLIVIVSLFLLVAHLVYSYVLRKEHPTIWLLAFPFEILFICILANINNSFIISSLEFYGIYSLFSNEKDAVLIAVPYYIDAILFATFVLSARIAVFVPLYYYFNNKESKSKKTIMLGKNA